MIVVLPTRHIHQDLQLAAQLGDQSRVPHAVRDQVVQDAFRTRFEREVLEKQASDIDRG